MSTDYKLEKEVRFEHLLDGRLESYGVYEYESEENIPGKFCVLTDGLNQIPVHGDDSVQSIKRFGRNDETLILQAICEAFDTRAFSEHDPQYWGYETEREWIAAEEYYNEHADEIYCSQLLIVLKQEKTLEDEHDRMLEDIELIDQILCESPELGSKDRLPELAEQYREKRDEERAALQALFASCEGGPDEDLITRILNRADK